MRLVITNVILSKNTVNTGEKFRIRLAVKEVVEEPNGFRLAFVLGKPKGNLSK